MFWRHKLLVNIAMISLLVVMGLGVTAGIVLALAIRWIYFIPAVSFGSVITCLPSYFILRWIRKDYIEIDNAIKQLTKAEK